jgi:hypothetical protein
MPYKDVAERNGAGESRPPDMTGAILDEDIPG